MASNNLQFNTSGALPQSIYDSGISSITGTSSPFGNALNSAQNKTSTPAINVQKPNTPLNVLYGGYPSVPTGEYANSSTPQNTQNILTAGLINPSTDNVKSHTITSTDASGATNTQKIDYHPPQSNQPATGNVTTPSGAVVNATSGSLVSAPLGVNTSTTQPSQQAPQSSAQPTASNATYPGLVNALTSVGVNGSTGYNTAVQNLTDFNRKLAQKYGDIESERIPLEFQQGREQVIARQAASEEAALQGAVNQQQTQQGQQIGALNSAASLSAPTPNTAFYGNPLTGGVAGAGADLMNASVAQAINLVKNGTDINDPSVQRLLSPFGAIGQSAFINALQGGTAGGGNFNPTIQSATAQQGAANTKQYQALSTQLDTSLKNLDNVSTTAVNFLNSNNLLNPTSNPHYNDAINSYVQNISNPGAAATYATLMGDLNNFKSQVLAANSGQTPTALTNTVKETDPSTLSAPALASYLQNLSTLGKQQLAVYQQQFNNSAQGGYIGQPASVNTNLASSPAGNLSITPDQAVQGVIGTGFNIVGGVEGIVNHLSGTAAALFE